MRYTGTWFKTKKEALEIEMIRRKEIKNPKPQKMTPLTFFEVINQRLDQIKAYNSPKYLTDHVYMARKWVRKWKDIFITEITSDMIQDYILERSKVSAHAANKDLRYLKATFGFAKEKSWITENPVTKVKNLPTEKRLKYIPPKEDILKVLMAAKSDTRDYLWLILDTVARVGEINKLTWNDVNFDERHIILYTRKKKGGHLTGRKISMTDRVYDILLRRYKQKDETKPWVFWQKHWDNKSGEVKTGPFGYRRRILKTLCKHAGVKDFRFHALRHFGASIMLHKGVPKGAIQKILGHERQTTTDIYLQALEDSDKKAIEILGKELNLVDNPVDNPVDNLKSAHKSTHKIKGI